MSPPSSRLRGEGKQDYFIETDGTIWNDAAIGAADTTQAVLCMGYDRKTVFFISDTDGNLTVGAREPDGGWQSLPVEAVVANTLLILPPTWDADAIRLSFSAAATVTAWYVFQ